MKKRSPKQKEATRRAWLILRLRGAFELFREMNCNEGMVVCNRELIKLRAKPEGNK